MRAAPLRRWRLILILAGTVLCAAARGQGQDPISQQPAPQAIHDAQNGHLRIGSPVEAPASRTPAPPQRTAPRVILDTRNEHLKISGQVVRPDGSPAAGATVRVKMLAPVSLAVVPLDQETATGADGTFALDPLALPGQPYRLVIAGPGLPAMAREEAIEAPPEPLTITGAAEAGWIRGRVKDALGRPLGHGLALASSTGGGFPVEVARGRVNGQGEFTIGPLAPGTYRIKHRLDPPDTLLLSSDGATTSSEVEATARPAGTNEPNPVEVVSGCTDVEYLKVQAVDAEGRPVAKYTLDVTGLPYGEGARVYRTLEVAPPDQEQGVAVIYNAAPGHYLIRGRTDEAAGSMEFEAEQTINGAGGTVRLTLKPQPKLTLDVRNEEDGPAAGARVRVLMPEETAMQGLRLPVSFKKTCDAQGRLELQCLRPGRYAVLADEDATHWVSETNFNIQAGRPARQVLTREARKGPQVAGRVTDEAGRPVAQATVYLQPLNVRTNIPPARGASAWTMTDREGRWSCTVEAAGSDGGVPVGIVVQHPKYYTTVVTSRNDESRKEPIVMQPAAALGVELTTEDPALAAELAHGRFQVYVSRVSPLPYSQSGMTPFGYRVAGNAAPAYEFPLLPRGEGLIITVRGAGWTAGEPVLLEDGREIKRGTTVTLPAQGKGRWIARVPMRRQAGGATEALTVGPIDLLLRDGESGAPLEGVPVSTTASGQATPDRISRPGGTLRLELRGGNRTVWFPANYIALSTSQGTLVNANMLTGVELTTGTRTEPGRAIEVRLIKVKNKLLALIFRDGMGHTIRGGVTLLDGPRRWVMPEMRMRGNDPGMLLVPQMHGGKSRYYVQTREGRNERVQPQSGYGSGGNGGIAFLKDERGEPCFEVDYDVDQASRIIYLDLPDTLEMPK